MKNLEKLRKKIIKSIHGLPYSKSINLEYMQNWTLNPSCVVETEGDSWKHIKSEYTRSKDGKNIGGDFIGIKFQDKGGKIVGMPIGLGRLLKGLNNEFKDYTFCYLNGIRALNIKYGESSKDELKCSSIPWILTKKNGEEAMLEDQSENTIKRLLELY